MSVVVAVESPDGAVHVGCDSFMGTASTRDLTASPKWYWHSRALLVGYAGDMRAGQVGALAPGLRHGPREADESYLARVAEVTRRTHAARGVEVASGTAFLLAYAGRCYEMQYDYSIFRNGLGYAAIGAGADVALGALAATPKLAPADRVRLALEAAARHCTAVCAPLRYVVVPPRKRR